MRLGHVGRHTDRYLGLAPDVPSSDAEHALAGFDDAAHVVVLFGWQADHEIEFQSVPAAGKYPVRRLLDMGLGDVFVDHIAHALGAGFGGKGQTGDPHGRHLVEDLFVEAIGAQRRHRHRGFAPSELAHDAFDQRRDTRVIGRAEAGERGLVVAGALDALDHAVHDRLRRALADRAVDHAGLAKPASLGAAAGDLDTGAVEYGLGIGHWRV